MKHTLIDTRRCDQSEHTFSLFSIYCKYTHQRMREQALLKYANVRRFETYGI